MRWILVAAGLAVLASSGTAFADPPTREPIPQEPFVTTSCGFDVLIEPVVGQFTLMTFPEGRPVVEFLAGPSLIRVSSDNGSVLLNVSGPAFTTLNHDGSVEFSGAGPWLFFEHPFANLPALAYVTGRLTFGSEEPTISVTGRVVDVCALLD
jgi:hypothetical protein